MSDFPVANMLKRIGGIVGIHPYAAKFPSMSSDALADLADDIARNGQRDPIDITPDGLVLDGRNRWEACKLAGVEPVVKVYDGNDLANYVISKNVNRRHMTLGQRAMATARVLHEDGRRVEGRWVRGSVVNPEFGINGTSKTWQNSMSKAGIILDFAPELAESVANGDRTLYNAFLEAKKPPPEPEPEPCMWGGSPNPGAQQIDLPMRPNSPEAPPEEQGQVAEPHEWTDQERERMAAAWKLKLQGAVADVNQEIDWLDKVIGRLDKAIARLDAVAHEPHPLGSPAGDAKTRARFAAHVSRWVETVSRWSETLGGLDTQGAMEVAQ